MIDGRDDATERWAPTPADRPGRRADLVWRVIGGVVATWGGAMFATLEVFLVPLRIAGVRAPVTLLLAVASNIVLILFARAATGSRAAALLPGLAWFVVTVVFSMPTAAGDWVLLGDWVALVLLLVGAASIVVGGYLAIVGRRR